MIPKIQENEVGYYFVLDGVTHGYWRTKALAILGREVELRRRAQRLQKRRVRSC